MASSNDLRGEGSTNPRAAARVLEALAGLVGGLGLLVGLLLLAEEGERTKGFLISVSAVGAAALLSVGAVVLRWLSAAFELAARRLEPGVWRGDGLTSDSHSSRPPAE